ncbi:MAG: NTP transferase domain-containing protein, partial [Wenzhouxiangellaceae bacterium]|nr:NTP transferase domain-containing protein [Wenzhouxiangellaceae bacterium]
MTEPSIIVLAGDRGPGDPLARRAGVPGKVLVEIGGKPMLSRVMEALDAFAAAGETIVVCRNHPEYISAIDSGRPCRRIDPAAGPAASVVAALDA